MSRRSVIDDATAVYVKEMRSLARDRHTVIYTLFLPLFLYPFLIWAIIQVLTYVRALEERVHSRVVLLDSSGEDMLATFLAGKSNLRLIDPPGLLPGDETGPAPGPDALEEEAAEWVRSGSADAVVIVSAEDVGDDMEAGEGGRGLELARGLRARILHDAAETPSRQARERLETAFAEYRRERLVATARAIGKDEAFLETIAVEERDLSTRQEFAKYVTSLILPLVMIVMTAMGAFYPALDATVGEKERGTLETTLVSPTRPLAVALGKYVAVVTCSFIAFFLNFLSMLLALSRLKLQLRLEGFELGTRSILIILGAALLLASLLSALMMLLGFLAKTFKEGQTYVTPIYLLTVLPAIATAAPDVTLNPGLALIPIVNIALLFREALRGEFHLPGILITLAVSTLVSAVALAAAARILRREEVRTGGDFSLRDVCRWALGRANRAPGVET
jgi:sodium transport system permease protein